MIRKTTFIILTIGFFLIFIQNLQAQNYQIGHTTITFNDPTRTGGFGSGGGPGRQIQTEIYYPANVAGVDVNPASGQFPVIVFGHGFVMTWSAYQNIWEHLVPQGYIIAFPRTEGSIFGTNHQQFGWDLQLLVTAIQQKGNDTNSILFGAVASETALMGHSMGGGAAFLAADSLSINGNINLKTLVGLAPAESSTNGVSSISSAANITVPAVVFSGIQDGVTPPNQHHIPMYDALASNCKTRINIVGGAHCYFANTNTNCDFGESTSSSGISISRIEQQSVMNDFLDHWLAYTLKGSCNDFYTFNDSLNNSNRINFQQACNRSSSLNQEICLGDSIFIGGTYRVTSGTYVDTLMASDGCDSLLITHLNISINDSSELSLNTCDSVIFNNVTYNASGKYFQTLSNINGCDSIVEISVNITTNDTSIFQSSCGSYEIGTNVFDSSGIYTLNYINQYQCDSIVNLHLTIFKEDTTEIIETACDEFQYNQTTYQLSGSYYHTYQNQNNCDSVVVLNLDIQSSSNLITSLFYDIQNNTITSNQSGVDYQWFDCETNILIDGANAQNFSPNNNGFFGVELDDGICQTNSQCIYIDNVSTKLLEDDNNFNIFPNPTNHKIFIQNKNNLKIEHLEIIDNKGTSRKILENINKSLIEIDLEELPNAVYFLKIQAKNKIFVSKIIKYQ